MNKVLVHGHELLYYDQSLSKEISKICDSEDGQFPGPQPISIERKHISNLKKKEYFVGIKNDGERFLLCFIKNNGQYISCLINRKFETFLINIISTKHLYEGTLCDCELVNNDLYIFDVLSINGQNIMKKPFMERLKEVDTVQNAIREIKHDIKIQRKNFKNMTEFCEIKNGESSFSDGYVFIPNNEHVVFGTHNTMYKWKPLYKNTVDFALMGNKVYLQNGGKLTWVKIKVKSDNIEIPNDTPVIVECEYVSEKNWNALHVRHDKNMPNSSYTYKRTLVNIQENIQEDEFIFT